MRIGYLRVSTQEQRPDRQIDGLQAICDELHIERLSGADTNRPIFQQVIEQLAPGDTLVVWDLDRAFRSTVDAVTEAEKLLGRGIDLRIVTLQVDTATPDGMLVYTVMAAFAEYERRVISRRTIEGLEAARRRGARLGRPSKLSPDQIRQATEALAEERSTIAALAADFGVAPWTLSRALKRVGAA